MRACPPRLLLAAVAALAGIGLGTVPAQAIIAGKVAGPGDAVARHTVLLVNSAANGCSGTLVGQRGVVTAAHCVPTGSRVAVAFMRGGQVLGVSRVVHIARHPGLVQPDGVGAPVDVAVLVMDRKAPSGFAPVRLAPRDVGPGETAVIAGFGRPRMNDPSADGQLRRVSLPVIARSRSGYVLMGDEKGLERGLSPSACQGDSGGPVFSQKGGLALAGVLSLVAGNNDRMGCGFLTVGMPAASIAGWIRGEIARGEALDAGAGIAEAQPNRPVQRHSLWPSLENPQ